jgi:hypothetical protein
MKIAITGHTKGIGKSLYDVLSVNHDVKGYSKSKGYDITKKTDRRWILKEVNDCDIFINNAYDDFAQSSMLYELWTDWHTKEKTIITIGSDVTKYDLPLDMKDLLQYQMHKKSLKILHEDLQNLNTSVKMEYVSFGYVGTEQILAKQPPIPKKEIMPVKDAIKIILERIK